MVDVTGLPVATLASSAGVAVGDDVVAIGHTLDLVGGPTVSAGIVSALDRSTSVDGNNLTGLLQTDAAISSGNSGGALVNAAGQVIGMVIAAATGDHQDSSVQNINFAIPADATVAVLRVFALIVSAP